MTFARCKLQIQLTCLLVVAMSAAVSAQQPLPPKSTPPMLAVPRVVPPVVIMAPPMPMEAPGLSLKDPVRDQFLAQIIQFKNLIASLDPKRDILLINKNPTGLFLSYFDTEKWNVVTIPAMNLYRLNCAKCASTVLLEFNNLIEQKRYELRVGSYYVFGVSDDRKRWVFSADP